MSFFDGDESVKSQTEHPVAAQAALTPDLSVSLLLMIRGLFYLT